MVESSEVIVSPRNSKGRRNRGYVQKPKSNVYTMMLILSFLFLGGACLFLHLEMTAYNYELKPGSAPVVATGE